MSKITITDVRVNPGDAAFLIDDGKSCHILRVTEEPLDNLIERASEIVHDVMAKE